MPMTQQDILDHYQKAWREQSEAATGHKDLVYSNPVEDAVLYPIYQQLLADLRITVTGGKVLDVGSGSGRWIRFFTERYQPALLMGTDFSQSSIDLLNRWLSQLPNTAFRLADITQEGLDLGERFDLINIANVLFHIPEQDRFTRAVANLARHLAPGGRIVTTEYLPRITMRTQWMLVRSRYEFEAAVRAAGLRIAEIRASSFFSNDPMGLDGPDDGTRGLFNQVRAGIQSLMGSQLDDNTRAFFNNLFAAYERACLSFCQERMAPIDLPSQKLVVLAKD